MQATFRKEIEFEDESKLNIDFTVDAGMGGIGAYELWGAKCHDSHLEIDNITFHQEGLTQKQIEEIQEKIESNDLDDDAWDAINNLPPEIDDEPKDEEEM